MMTAQALDVEEQIALVKRAEAAALDYDPRITNSEGAGLDTHFSQIVYANTHGFVGEYRTSSFSLAVSPIADAGGTMQRDSWYAVSRQFKQLEAPDVIGKTAAKRALRRLGARKVATQEAPVVFDPEMAASLLRTLAGAVSGTSIYRGSSFLLNRLGQQVAADTVTVIDDGTIPGALGLTSIRWRRLADPADGGDRAWRAAELSPGYLLCATLGNDLDRQCRTRC